MRRTRHARFVGIGREQPEYVDKRMTPGRAYTNAERIAAELRGEGASWQCSICGVWLALDTFPSVHHATNACKEAGL